MALYVPHRYTGSASPNLQSTYLSVDPESSVAGRNKALAAIKSSILSEAALSFLGLGEPTIKSWGSMLYYAQAKDAFMTDAWLWWVIPPGLCIAVLSFGLMLVGYVIEGNMNPEMEAAV